MNRSVFGYLVHLSNVSKRRLLPLSLLLAAAIACFASTVPTAHAATLNTLNFQARLQTNPGGGVVPDGYYNVEFKIYNASSSSGSSQGSCTGDSNCLWTETYYDSNGVTAGNDNRVRVAHGYLTVNLGSLTSFPAMNWDQNLYITMNVGGTTQTATPTWNGEMSPRLALTAVPYAFKAGGLATGNGTLQSTLSILQPTVGNQTFQIQDQGAGGTYNLCIQSSSACGFATGSGVAILQGGNTFGADMNIGTNDGSTKLNLMTGGTTRLAINSTGQVSIGGATGAKLALAATTSGTEIGILVNSATNQTADLLQVNAINTSATTTNGILFNRNGSGGTTTNGINVTNTAGTLTNGLSFVGTIGTDINRGSGTLSLNGAGGINLKTNGTTTASLSSTGAALFKNTSDAANAFQVQNATGDKIFGIDTVAPTTNYITNSSFETNTTGWAAVGSASVGQNTTATNSLHLSNSLSVTTTATANDGVRVSTFTGTPNFATSATWNFIFNLKLASGTFTTMQVGYNVGAGDVPCTVNTLLSTNAATNGFTQFSCAITLTTGQTISSLFIKQTDATVRTVYIDAVQLNTVSTNLPYASVTAGTQLNGVLTAPLSIVPTSDSTATLMVRQSSSNNITLLVDTVNNYVASSGSFIAVGAVNAIGGFQVNGTTVISNARAISNITNYNQTSGTLTLTSNTTSDLATISSTNTSGTQTNGIIYNRNGASGTTTNGINVTNTAGTLTNGLTFTGTIGTDINRDTGTLSLNGAGGIDLKTNGTATATLSSTGAALFKNSSNSSSAFQIQNSTGDKIIGVDTTSAANNYVTNNSLETNTTGWAATGSASISQNTTATNSWHLNNSLQVTTTAVANDGARVSTFSGTPNFATSANWYLAFYIKLSSGTFTTLQAGYNVGGGDVTCTLVTATVVTTGFYRTYCPITLTTGQTIASLFVRQSDATARTVYVDGVQLTPTTIPQPFQPAALQLNGLVTTPINIMQPANGEALNVYSANGTAFLNVNTAGALLNLNGDLQILNQSVITSARAITNITGYSQTSGTLSLVSTTTSDLATISSTNTSGTQTNGVLYSRNGSSGTTTNGINITNTAGTLTNGLAFTGTIGTDINRASGTLSINGAGGIDFKTATNTTFSLGSTGATLFKNSSDSATAFQVQNAANNQILTVDTSGSQVILGKAGASGVTGKLVLQNATNSNTVSIQSGTTSSSYTLTLPTALSGGAGDCLKDTTGAGVLGFASCGATAGVTTVGSFSGSSQANGASISTNTITFGPADASNPGMVSTSTQTFAGDKTLSGNTALGGTLNQSSTTTSTLATITSASTSGTQTNGIFYNRNASGGTTTNGINITQTLGTLTNGLAFGGTIGTDIMRATGTLTLSGASGVRITSGAAYLGVAGPSGTTGSLTFHNATNSNTVTIQSATTSTGYTLFLPAALGSTGDCLKDTGSGILSFGGCTGSTDVTTIGSINSQTKSANGAVIFGNNLVLQTADASSVGLVSTIAQTFAGDKTLSGNTALGGTLNQTVNTTSDLATFSTANTAGTQTNGILYNRNGASGTTTNGINITNTAGTLTNGLSFTGTIGSDINRGSGTLSLNGAGGISLKTNGTQTASLSSTGQALFKNSSDSGTAFQIQDSNAGLLFTADTTNGQLIIGQKTDTSGTDTTWTRVSDSTAGVIKTGGTASITGVWSSVVYNGSLYVGTVKTNAAEVYRYDGNGSWTVINTTAGRFNTTTGIDFVSAMTVYNGSLYIGTSETAKGELYRYDGGTGTSVFTAITSTTAGTIASGSTAYDGISAMAVFNGKLYFGANKNDAAAVYTYGGSGVNGTDVGIIQSAFGQPCSGMAAGLADGIDSMVAAFGTLYIGVSNGGSGAVLCTLDDSGVNFDPISSTTYGSFIEYIAGTTLTGIDTISKMTVFNGRLLLGINDNLGTYVLESMQGNTADDGTNALWFMRLNNAVGQIVSSGTSSITGTWAMTVYQGALYIGTSKVGGAEIYRYNGGYGTQANWTKVSQATAGTIAASGTAGVDTILTLQPFNNKLYAGTYDTGSNNAEVYENYVVSAQSYALSFQASAGSTQQSGFPNQGSISFIADDGPNGGGSGMNTSGAFLFSVGIITQSGAYDIAEDYATRDSSLQQGDVIAADPNEQEFVRKATKPTDTIVGVYSTKPALRLSQEDVTINGGRAVPVALAGRVPVKVSSRNGTIKPGDLITMSDRAGVAMKADKSGFIIGRSLGFYNDANPDNTGTVMLFMNLSWYGGLSQDATQGGTTNQSTDQSQAAGSNTSEQAASANVLNVSGLTTGVLTVTGDASFQGNVTVVGNLQVSDLQISGHIATKGKAPKLDLQPYAGSDSIDAFHRAKATIIGNDTVGKIIITIGDLDQYLQPGDLLKVSFDRQFADEPQVFLNARNAQAAQLGAFVEQATTKYFIITVANPVTPGASYSFSYYVVQ